MPRSYQKRSPQCEGFSYHRLCAAVRCSHWLRRQVLGAEGEIGAMGDILVFLALSARLLEWCPWLQGVQKQVVCQIWPQCYSLLISVSNHLQEVITEMGSSCPKQWLAHISTHYLLSSIFCLTDSTFTNILEITSQINGVHFKSLFRTTAHIIQLGRVLSGDGRNVFLKSILFVKSIIIIYLISHVISGF